MEAEAVQKELFAKIDDERHACVVQEDARFKFRVELVRRAAIRAAAQLWARAEQLWSHMDRCADIRFSAEVASVKQLVALLQQAIESEQKVLHELVLHGDSFLVDKHVFMYEPPSPPEVPAEPVEPPRHDAFTVAQLEQLAGELSAVYPDHVAPHGRVTALLHGLSAVAMGTSMLPAAWLALPAAKVGQLTAALGSGPTVDWRQLIVAGMDLPVATPTDVLAVCAAADGATSLSREQFVAKPMWFDAANGADGVFPRAAGCKSLLFDLFAGGNGNDRTVRLTTVATWLCRCVDDATAALQTALAIAHGDVATEIAGDAALDLASTAAALNYDSGPGGVGSSLNPVGDVVLGSLWKELGGTCTAQDLVKQAEIAHAVKAKFSRVDLGQFSNLVSQQSS
mmetsp:Transcript_393/g.1095  ORF Transcript_393/g.1095 Transcript_393/m.1095 type:complete len:397 (+) Transcript_393:1478-2668(+)